MALEDFFNTTVTIYAASRTTTGTPAQPVKKTASTGTSVSARKTQLGSMFPNMPIGEIRSERFQFVMPAGTTIFAGDTITEGTTNFKVVSVMQPRGPSAVHHIRVEAVKRGA